MIWQLHCRPVGLKNWQYNQLISSYLKNVLQLLAVYLSHDLRPTKLSWTFSVFLGENANGEEQKDKQKD